MKVWVYTERNDDNPNLMIDVYDTKAAANQRLRYSVGAFFEKPFDEIDEITWDGTKTGEALDITADRVEYYSGRCTYHWDVDEREVMR